MTVVAFRSWPCFAGRACHGEREIGGISFLLLRDRSGTAQHVVEGNQDLQADRQGRRGGTGLFSVDYFDTRVFLAQAQQFHKQALVAFRLERVFEIGRSRNA